MGLEMRLFNASTIAEIDRAFAALASERPDVLFISSGPFFSNRSVQLAHLAIEPVHVSEKANPNHQGDHHDAHQIRHLQHLLTAPLPDRLDSAADSI